MRTKFQYTRSYTFKAEKGRRKYYSFNLEERFGEVASFRLNDKDNRDTISATIELEGDVETAKFLYYGKEFILRADRYIPKGYPMSIDGRLKKNEDSLRDAHLHTISNREEVEASKTCHCISCQTFFPTSEIDSYADGGETVICPYCDVDAVIGDCSGIRLSDDTLNELYRRYFNYDDIE